MIFHLYPIYHQCVIRSHAWSVTDRCYTDPTRRDADAKRIKSGVKTALRRDAGVNR
jgi:hypothetical protein